MEGLGIYLSKDDHEWKFAYFKNNVLSKEFEKGNYDESQKSIPNFGALEKKY